MAKTNSAKVAVDSCTLISRIEGKPKKYQDGIENLFADIDARRVALYGSTLLIAEVLDGGFSAPLDAEKDAKVLAFMDNPNQITLVQATRQVALTARELRRKYKLGPADAIHLASAIFVGAEYFMTTDETDFPIGHKVYGVQVLLPDSPFGTSVLGPA